MKKEAIMPNAFDTDLVIHRPKHDKKPALDIAAEPEMVELKRMIRDGELDANRTIETIEDAIQGE